MIYFVILLLLECVRGGSTLEENGEYRFMQWPTQILTGRR